MIKWKSCGRKDFKFKIDRLLLSFYKGFRLVYLLEWKRDTQPSVRRKTVSTLILSELSEIEDILIR